ncbi:hypothetical protein Salat_2664400 [Sesamum alatum]|uniref:Uncharacterized protein n=1 Tax=Sesamum alatum TaxID=300844 RepID=A0AAE1XPB9_9LAMI|nr:hypothetical protein Salat_2664400 [Sesamum alatum]
MVPGSSDPSSFRFQNMWLRHSGFMPLVEMCWSMPLGLEFFRELLTLDPHRPATLPVAVVPRLISSDQGDDLLHAATLAEVRWIIMDISLDSAAGSDGFNAVFPSEMLGNY